MDQGYLLEATTWLAPPPGEVFDFFGDARNLEALSLPFLHFEILTPDPITMGAGTVIDYRLRLHGLPVRWRTEITVWEPPRRFVDTQVRGPYRWWIHEHRFEPAGGGTLMTDRVEYGVPGGALVNFLLVESDLRRIWEYRDREVRRHLGALGS
ncbi:MAG: CDP-paratose 2-epimerase [Gemmatimonas sp. SM23_52]|nr:MAG: CDP-paratose 2-epimerase [Gemmatimonas sp. SM23_52]